MDIEFLKASKSDFETIFELSSILHSDDKIKTPDQIKAEIKIALESRFIWVAKLNNEMIGFGMVELCGNSHRNFPNSIFVAQLFVDIKFRKKGIGKKLMSLMLNENYPQKYKYFSVTHDPGCDLLTKFYESFGFKVDGVTKALNVKMIKEK